MLGREIYITTRQLILVPLNEEWEQLQELIWKLHKEGMENKEISNTSIQEISNLEEQKCFQENLFGVYWKDTVQEKGRKKT